MFSAPLFAYVVHSAILVVAALIVAVLKRKIGGLLAAAAAVVVWLVTTGFDRVVFVNLYTLPIALLAAVAMYFAFKNSSKEKEAHVR